jgi:hypothetical protein
MPTAERRQTGFNPDLRMQVFRSITRRYGSFAAQRNPPAARDSVLWSTPTNSSRPRAGPKRRSTHQVQTEGGRTKHRLDKFRRGGRSIKCYDDGGAAAGSTRSPDDPGGEIAAQTRAASAHSIGYATRFLAVQSPPTAAAVARGQQRLSSPPPRGRAVLRRSNMAASGARSLRRQAKHHNGLT